MGVNWISKCVGCESRVIGRGGRCCTSVAGIRIEKRQSRLGKGGDGGGGGRGGGRGGGARRRGKGAVMVENLCWITGKALQSSALIIFFSIPLAFC